MKKLIYSLSIVSVLILGACSDNTEDNKKETEEREQTNQEQQTETVNEITPEEQEAIDKLNVQDDTDIQATIEQEEGVTSAIVTSMDSNGTTYVMADIKVENGTEIDTAPLAKKYADQLKEKYPDNVVDVKVQNDTETLAQETRE